MSEVRDGAGGLGRRLGSGWAARPVLRRAANSGGWPEPQIGLLGSTSFRVASAQASRNAPDVAAGTSTMDLITGSAEALGEAGRLVGKVIVAEIWKTGKIRHS